MRLRILTVAASILVASALSTGAVLATDESPSPEISASPTPTLVSTLDQGQNDAGTTYSPTMSLVQDGSFMAQTFTAGADGPLDRISVNLSLPVANGVRPADQGSADGQIDVFLTGTSAGTPAAPLLGNWTLTPVSGWNDITLDPPTDVTAGTLYAVIVRGHVLVDINWNGTCSPTAYTGGAALVGDGESSWPEVSTVVDGGCPTDFAFRTYVEVAPAAATDPPVATTAPVATIPAAATATPVDTATPVGSSAPTSKMPPPTSTTSGDGQNSGGTSVLFLLIAGLAAAAACVPFGIRRRALAAVKPD